MGILDDNTRRVLSDGRIFNLMHKISDRQTSGRAFKVEVRVPAKGGGQPTIKQVIIRKVTR